LDPETALVKSLNRQTVGMPNVIDMGIFVYASGSGGLTLLHRTATAGAVSSRRPPTKRHNIILKLFLVQAPTFQNLRKEKHSLCMHVSELLTILFGRVCRFRRFGTDLVYRTL
jgi:hypothetical protein